MKKMMKKSVAIIAVITIIFSLFLFASCNKKKQVLENDTVFYIDTLNSVIMENVSFSLFVDDSSYIALRKDGTATIHIRIKDGLGSVLNYALGAIGGIQDMDLRPYINGMVSDFLPGFSLSDMETTLQLIKNSMGLELFGIDPDDPDLREMFAYIEETGRIPESFNLPSGIGLEYNAVYEIKDVYSSEGDKYIQVLMGEHVENGEPYTIMTLSEDHKSLGIYIQMVKLDLVAKTA